MAASEETLTSLRDEIELLETYFELEKLRFGNKFNYEIKAAPDVDPLRYRIPALLIHLFAATSLNDRFLDEDDPGLLRIAFRKADERLICSINSESQYESSPFDASRNQDIWNKIQERIRLLRDFYGIDIGVGRSGNNIVDISLPIVDVRSSDRGNGGPEAKG
jgi:LytS/YehU family sensor histidine kinase